MNSSLIPLFSLAILRMHMIFELQDVLSLSA